MNDVNLSPLVLILKTWASLLSTNQRVTTNICMQMYVMGHRVTSEFLENVKIEYMSSFPSFLFLNNSVFQATPWGQVR